MVMRNVSVPLTLLIVALVIVIAYDGVRLVQDLQFNDALNSGIDGSIPEPDDAHRRFAAAYGQQQDFKSAIKAYAAVDARPGSRLHLHVKFNLANLYFREAQRLRDAGDEDLAMPLIELAKQNYKEILRSDAAFWDAKYNLELALVLAPESDPIDPSGERNPERSPRAISKIRSRESLP